MKNWFLAIRPKTLPAGIAPVMIGSAMALGDGSFRLGPAIACLAGALLIQIGTNLANDYFDFKKGADTERVGPVRVTQAGLIKPETVFTAAIITFALAVGVSAYLAYEGGPIIAALAVISIFSGIIYTAGPYPLAYMGLGELFVLIFFGPVAVGGTYFIQTHDLNMAIVTAGFGPGLISCAILAINNLRDTEGDRKAGKNTLAVRFGTKFARWEYAVLMLAAAAIPFLVFSITHDHLGVLFACAFILPAAVTIRTVMTTTDAVKFNKALAQTGLWLLLYSIVFSIGWVLCSR